MTSASSCTGSHMHCNPMVKERPRKGLLYSLDIIRQQRHLINPKRSKVLPKSFTDTGNNKNCEEEHANNDNEVK